jgi:CheY-like chemotaxis protein
MDETGFPHALPTSGVGVLVIDDEPSIGRLMEAALGGNGFRVRTALSGPDGLNLLRGRNEDIRIVLLDVQMPGMDGPWTLAQLRALRPDLLVCFMSGNTGVYSERMLLEMGAVRVFQKPFPLTEIVETLRQLAGLEDRRKGLRLVVPESAVMMNGHEARLHDRSPDGLGLWVPAPLEVGRVLRVRFGGEASAEWSVEVRHCRPHDDGWAVGCRVVG